MFVTIAESPARAAGELARLIGFDYRRLLVLLNALLKRCYQLSLLHHHDQVICRSNCDSCNIAPRELQGRRLGFKPRLGWQGTIEFEDVHARCRSGQEVGRR